MNKAAMFSVLALTASVFADEELVAAAQKMNGQNQQMNNKSPQMNNVILTSARPESENGWYLFADVLYWHADIGNTGWAMKTPDETDALTSIHKDERHLDFKWSWGFKVGIGANIDHDMWDTNLTYTWFRTENSQSAGVPSEGVIRNLIGGDGPNFTSGRINWDLRFNMFDWELGRWHYVSKSLALRPHIGLKGGWINQTIHLRTNVLLGTSDRTNAKYENNFWGVGPSIGVNTLWVLGNAGSNNDHRFSLFGDFGGALMYGHYQVKDQETSSAAGVTESGNNVHDLTRNRQAAMLQGQMGLEWDTAFNRNRNHFTMKVGYELQYWFRQNQLLRQNQERFSDDLALQGVTAEIRFDF